MKDNPQRQFLVLVTPARSAVDEFMRHNPSWRVDDVVWISNRQSLSKVRGLELKFENVHFLHRSYEIENAKEEILARVRDYPLTTKGNPMTTPQPTEKLEEDVEKRFDEQFDTIGFPIFDKKLFESVKAFLTQELSKQREEAKLQERREIKEEIDSLIDGHYDNPNLAREIEKLFDDINYLESLTKGTK